jgi:hypothetical protein
MNRYLMIIAASFFVSLCSAQKGDNPKLNAISLELGKTGFICNVTFDHKFQASRYGVRIGAGSNLSIYLNVISFGGGGYRLFGATDKFFELGLDLQYLLVHELSDDQRGFASIFVYPNYPVKTLHSSLNLGYRRYRNKSLFRIGLAPGIIGKEFVPGGYISYGVRF